MASYFDNGINKHLDFSEFKFLIHRGVHKEIGISKAIFMDCISRVRSMKYSYYKNDSDLVGKLDIRAPTNLESLWNFVNLDGPPPGGYSYGFGIGLEHKLFKWLTQYNYEELKHQLEFYHSFHFRLRIHPNSSNYTEVDVGSEFISKIETFTDDFFSDSDIYDIETVRDLHNLYLNSFKQCFGYSPPELISTLDIWKNYTEFGLSVDMFPNPYLCFDFISLYIRRDYWSYYVSEDVKVEPQRFELWSRQSIHKLSTCLACS